MKTKHLQHNKYAVADFRKLLKVGYIRRGNVAQARETIEIIEDAINESINESIDELSRPKYINPLGDYDSFLTPGLL